MLAYFCFYSLYFQELYRSLGLPTHYCFVTNIKKKKRAHRHITRQNIGFSRRHECVLHLLLKKHRRRKQQSTPKTNLTRSTLISHVRHQNHTPLPPAEETKTASPNPLNVNDILSKFLDNFLIQ